MRKAIIAPALAALGLAAAPAGAMPFPPLSDAAPGVTLIAQGCGPGWHRNPWGRCVRNSYAYVAPARYAYGYVYRPYPYYRHCWWTAPGVRVCS